MSVFSPYNGATCNQAANISVDKNIGYIHCTNLKCHQGLKGGQIGVAPSVDSLESLLNVPQEIICVLNAKSKPHQAVTDASCLHRRFTSSRMLATPSIEIEPCWGWPLSDACSPPHFASCFDFPSIPLQSDKAMFRTGNLRQEHLV